MNALHALLAAAVTLLVQAPQPNQATPEPKASIEGFVVRAGTNEPIAKARVNVKRVAGPGGGPLPQSARPDSVRAATTDAQGRFLVNNLEPGSYALEAQRTGFALHHYGERAPGRPGTQLTIASGQAMKEIVFRLAAAGAISGRVSDAESEPLAGIDIQIVRSTYDFAGKRHFERVGTGATDDHGEYRVHWIPPGRYYVAASAQPTDSDVFRDFHSGPGANQIVEAGYPITYYPGTTEPASAAAIELQSGAELSTIDFVLKQQPVFRVRGRLAGTRSDGPPNVHLYLNPSDRLADDLWMNRPSWSNGAVEIRNGTFEIRNVVPGSYWVTAYAEEDGKRARIAVDVSNADVEDLILNLSSRFSIKGRIELEGGAPLLFDSVEPTALSLSPLQESVDLPRPYAVIGSDGAFDIRGVSPGDYRLGLSHAPRDTYVKAARLAASDVLDRFSISGPVSERLEILLSANGGQIDGTILDGDGKGMSGIEAILMPERQTDRVWERIRIGSSDQSGRFTIRAIPPGRYKLFAWEDVEPNAYYDPDFARKYEPLGGSVSISENSRVSVEVKAIPAGQ